MRFRTLRLLGVVLAVSTAGPAYADPTAREILLRPIAPYGTDYLSGLADGIRWVNAKGGAPLFCPPRTVSILPTQYREILRRKVEADPGLAGAHAGYVLLLALADAFPCAGRAQ
jgi:hypothetical protein